MMKSFPDLGFVDLRELPGNDLRHSVGNGPTKPISPGDTLRVRKLFAPARESRPILLIRSRMSATSDEVAALSLALGYNGSTTAAMRFSKSTITCIPGIARKSTAQHSPLRIGDAVHVDRTSQHFLQRPEKQVLILRPVNNYLNHDCTSFRLGLGVRTRAERALSAG